MVEFAAITIAAYASEIATAVLAIAGIAAVAWLYFPER